MNAARFAGDASGVSLKYSLDKKLHDPNPHLPVCLVPSHSELHRPTRVRSLEAEENRTRYWISHFYSDREVSLLRTYFPGALLQAPRYGCSGQISDSAVMPRYECCSTVESEQALLAYHRRVQCS